MIPSNPDCRDTILQVNGLTKYFSSVKALDNVSFNVARGSICGILGPNGAGKTTLLRIINSIISHDSGTITVNSLPASLQTTSPLIGYMPEERGLYDKMRVSDQILYFGQLKGGDTKRLREVMKQLIAKFELTGMENRRIKELSKGNQQKVQIIATLVHEPELLILDEPFSGFDPINGAILSELIEDLHRRGTTIMLSSHNMPAIESICNDILLIDHGKLLLNGPTDKIKDQHKSGALLLRTLKPINTELLQSSGTTVKIDQLEDNNQYKGTGYRIFKSPGTSNSQLLNAISYQAEILRFEEELPTLQEIFINAVNPQQHNG